MIRIRLYCLAACSLFFFKLSAQDHFQVPQQVKAQFAEDFISASSTAWTDDHGGNYVASFVHQSEAKTAHYAKDGTWLLTETNLSQGQTPSTVIDALSDNFRINSIEQITKIQTLQGIYFRFSVRIKGTVYDIEVDSSGRIRNKKKVEVINEDRKDDDDEEAEEDDKADKKHKKKKAKKPRRKDKNH